ncbi:MAG: T9SS type A sorting domain-containing protein [Bacteroidia bacterium]
MIRFYSLVSLIFFASIYVNAQTQTATLDANNTRIKVLNGGDFFWDHSAANYEVPKVKDQHQVSKSTIFTGAIWIGGYDDSGKLHLAAMTYRQRGKDFATGPVSNNTDSTSKQFDHIYVVSASDIQAHLVDPTQSTSDILNWPGNGDTTLGQPWQLAPFMDINSNGIYEPIAGDYPKIKGDIAAYCIYNDFKIHTETGGTPLNIDVHQMFYQEKEGTGFSLFEEVNLAYFKIVNRSDNNYRDLRFGIFTDFDIGSFVDDFVACDTVQRMGYAFNGDDFDEGVHGYGENPPAQSVVFLNSPLGAVSYWNNNANPINGNPTQAIHFYNLLSGLWNTGHSRDHIIGQDTFDGRFMFCGDPVTGLGWTETNNLNLPADRRLLTAAEPTSLKAGESLCFDIAFVYGRTKFGGALGSISVMKSIAAQVQQAYNLDYEGWQSFGCAAGNQMLSIPRIPESELEAIYPNPTAGLVHFSLPVNGRLFNATGVAVMHIEEVRSIDLSEMASGIYYLRTEKGSFRIVKL